jgi:hypothetical protein
MGTKGTCFVVLALAASGCHMQLTREYVSSLADTQPNNPTPNVTPTPNPTQTTTPMGACTYAKAPQDLSITPLTLTHPLMMLFLRGTDSDEVPFVSSDGGKTFPTRRNLPFDSVNTFALQFYDNLGHLSYLTYQSTACTLYTSSDEGATFQSRSFPVNYHPPLQGYTGIFMNADGSFYEADARLIANTNSNWQVRKIAANNTATVMDEYVPAGMDSSQALSVTQASNGYLYASGFTSKASTLNGNPAFTFNLDLRRSTDGGTTWTTIQSKTLGFVGGYNNSELFPVSNGTVINVFASTDPNGSHSLIQVIQPNGTVQDITAATVGTDMTGFLMARSAEEKLAFFSHHTSGGTLLDSRAVYILDMKTLSRATLDFSFNANDPKSSFENLRFIPETGDLAFSGFGTSAAGVQSRYYTEAITCH